MTLQKTVFGQLKKTFKVELISGSEIINDYGQGRCGGALHPDGNIYMSPNASTKYVKLNTSGDSVTELITGYSGGGAKWHSSVLAPNGCVYSPTANGSLKPLKYNPITNIATQIGALNGVVYGSYSSALAPNAMIYCTPHRAGRVMKVNPSNDTTAYIGTDYAATGTNKWSGIANANNGKLYCAPFAFNQILEIDPTTDTTAMVGPDLSSKGTDKYISLTLARNGNLYLAPFGASRILEYNPVTGASQEVGPVFSGGGKFYGITTGINGKLYLIPYSYPNVVEYNIGTGKAVEIKTLITGSQKYIGCVNTGRSIYITPFGANSKVCKITVSGNDVFGADAVMPSDLSQLPTSNYNKYFNRNL